MRKEKECTIEYQTHYQISIIKIKLFEVPQCLMLCVCVYGGGGFGFGFGFDFGEGSKMKYML